MPHMRTLGLAFGLTAFGLAATAAHGGVADRPLSARCPLDGFCCPYGLGQWEGRPHRYVHRDGSEAPRAATGAPLPFLVDPTRAAVGSQGPRHDFYDDVGDRNFDCPAYREPPAAAETNEDTETPCTHPACRGEETREATCEEACEGEPYCEMPVDEMALRGLEESLADWHHSAGQWVVQHLNAQSDGLDETEAGELDWDAIALEMEGIAVGVEGADDEARRDQEAVRGLEGEEDADDWFRPRRGDREPVRPVPPPQSDEDDTYQGPYHRWDGQHDRGGAPASPWQANEAAHEPGRLREWCGQRWDALRSAARDIARRLEQLSEEVTAGPAPPDGREPSEAGRPHPETARPPLPDYFLPAFGSPWDGEL